MAVYRVNKNRGYTVMANYHLRDKTLSLKAVGLLSKMLSFNDGWQFSTKGLSAICKEGPDAVLAALRELEVHGYPYVWGGSNPSTSFDCSGFVSYVLTNSGLINTGRLGAQGLYNVCSPVSSADVKPGDLVFFVGTYDTPGVSHVGIYVGDNVMLHCGDPIQYTSINTSYWQSHFYAFGRPNY